MCPVCGPLFGQSTLRANLVCHCLLVETQHGLVLIDTGLGLQDYQNPQARLGKIVSRIGGIEYNQDLSAIAQIQKLGFKPEDVRHIIVSHLDFDHAGGISDFPYATVHVLASEYNATQNLKSLKAKIRYRTQQFQQHRYWNFIEPNATDTWFNLTQAHGLNLFQDEILMIPLLGHTAGHSGITIKQSDGWLLFCGDAYYSHQQLDPSFHSVSLNQLERAFATDNQLRISNLSKIQQLAQDQPEIEIICAHDPIELARYQRVKE